MRPSTCLQTAIAILITSFPASLPAQESAQDLADKWTSAYNNHNREALGAVYTDDAQLMMHGAPTHAGRDSIEAFWAADFEEGNPVTILTVTHSIEGVDMTLVHGNYHVIDRDDGSILGPRQIP